MMRVPADTDILEMLAQDNSLSVRVAVAENEQAPAALLEALMKGEARGETLGELHFKMNVVGNRRVPVALLRIHAQHEDQNVRRVIAEHPQTPPKILASLAQDPYVQIAVAGNWQTPVEVLQALTQQEFGGLEYHEQTRQRLSQDGNRYVRAIARVKSAQMGEVARSGGEFTHLLTIAVKNKPGDEMTVPLAEF